ncbi:MAG TPA: phage baseplate assembly protein V [Kofleriaceae bacterium]
MNEYRLQGLQRQLYGVCAGLVEDNDDPEHEGRVLVRFPWLDDTTVSDWCRVSQLYAGNGYGALFVPEKQDEVLVAFVHGEMAEPMVIGGVYNGNDKPAAYHDSKANKDPKLIRTKGGHQILLDDGSQSKQVAITSNGKHTVLLDDQNKQVQISSAGGHQIVLDDTGLTLSVKSSTGAKIEIDATGKVTITGTSEVDVNAPTIKLTAGAITLAGSVNLG